MKDTIGSRGHEALTDPQTGLPNKLHWDTVSGVIFAAGARGIPLTLILVEVDDYQVWIGDRDQTTVGRVFYALGDVLENTTRNTDLSARTREERFAFLLLDCNLAGGRLVVDRLNLALDPIREMAGMAFSTGVAALTREMTRLEDLAGAAEEALRKAQARGKNQIEFQELSRKGSELS